MTTATATRPTRSTKGPQRTSLPTRTRMRGQIIAGILVIVGAALIGALVFLNAGDRVTALAVRDAVPAGQVITRANLVSTSIAGVDGAIPVEDASKVVGKTATVGLVPDQIITQSLVSDGTLPAKGEAITGLSLTAAQIPSAGVDEGDAVRLIAVPGADTTASGDLGETVDVLAERAIVYSVKEATTGDAVALVSVVVPEAQANRIALYSAAGRVAVVRTPDTGSE
jgi:hypothetical protein